MVYLVSYSLNNCVWLGKDFIWLSRSSVETRNSKPMEGSEILNTQGSVP